MNGAEYIVNFFEKKGVDVVFGYPGGRVISFYDVLGKSSIKHFLTRHEQGAAHAADGYARVTGKPGVCIATSGPGATNLVTGLANAYLDSVPIIAITGQVGVDQIGKDTFQEADISGITMPITKHNYLVKEIETLPAIMEEAWHVAISGRPGPVVIDIPSNIFVSEVDITNVPKPVTTRKVPLKNGLDEQLNKVIEALKNAKRPLVLAGGGVIIAQACQELQEFCDYAGIPVVNTLMGKGAIQENQEKALGMVGMHGIPAANLALSSCDLLLALGARFSDRVTGKPQSFLTDSSIIHVDIDPAELSKNVDTDVPVVCDAKKFLGVLLERLKENETCLVFEEWNKQIKDWQKEYRLSYIKDGELKPQEIIEKVAEVAGEKAIVVTDVGQHQMFAAQFYPLGGTRNFVTSGGLGTMGFGLPASMGATIGRPDESIVLFTGDGSFQMNIQELATIAQYNLPVKVFVMNNSCLGMVRQWQELFYKENYVHTIFTGGPDFVKLAEAYGIKAKTLEKSDDINAIIQDILDYDGPVIVDCKLGLVENVLPIVPPGGKPNEMLGRWRGETHISSIG